VIVPAKNWSSGASWCDRPVPGGELALTPPRFFLDNRVGLEGTWRQHPRRPGWAGMPFMRTQSRPHHTRRRHFYPADAAELHNLRVHRLGRLFGPELCRRLGIYPIPEGLKLSIVIPVFNERRWIAELLRRVKATPFPKEIIVVDDGSNDGTGEFLESLDDPEIQVVRFEQNRGKGAALRAGFARAAGSIVVVQDGDLEYDPADYVRLLQPIVEERADVVFGSRFLKPGGRLKGFWHALANRLITAVAGMLCNWTLTDMETGYKAFRREVLAGLTLRSNRFGFEPEFVAKIARKRSPPWRVFEVPIDYQRRSRAEGKKLGWKDGLAALWWIFRYWWSD
jgi:hypothetical protein